MMRIVVLALLAGLSLSAHAQEMPAEQAEDQPKLLRSGEVVNFRLMDQDGRSHEIYRHAEAPAVVLYMHGVGCPIVRQSLPHLKALRDEFAERGVVFLMVNANPQDKREDIAEVDLVR